jgi:hypothetical protein
MSKKVAVLFSGGLDSTYLVYKNLKEGNTVYPVYIEITNNQVKSLIEKNRIELLRREFLKEFKLPSHGYNEPVARINYLLNVGVVANESSLHLRQLPVWMLGLSFMQSMGVDEIQIGYVSNDDAISYLDEIQAIYKSYQLICEPMIPLVFPLTKKHKFQIADELPHQYMKYIFSCENADLVNQKDRDKLGEMGKTPVHDFVRDTDEDSIEMIEYEACCNCVPCRTIISSNYYGKGYYPDSYKKNLYDSAIRALERAGYSVKDERTGAEYKKKVEDDDYWKVVAQAPEPKPLRREYIQMDFDFDAAVAPEYMKNAFEEYLKLIHNGMDEKKAYAQTMVKARKMGDAVENIVDCKCSGDVCDCKSYLDDDDVMIEKG